MGVAFDELYITLVTAETCPFFDGIESMLRSLRRDSPHVVVGALSNACGGYVRRVLSANGVDSLFAVQFGVDDVPKPKPYGDGLLQCCKALGVEPAEAIYVGDAPTDGKAARAAGMQSIGVVWGSFEEAVVGPEFDTVVATPSELHNALARRAAMGGA